MKYAYIDEYGAFGFKFEDPGCTASMILTASMNYNSLNASNSIFMPSVAVALK